MGHELLDNNDAFFDAIARGNVHAVEQLLPHAQSGSGSAINSKRNTALLHAVKFGQTEVARILLQHSVADINVQNRKGYTALVQATRSNNSEMVRLLLDYGADPEITNNYGDCALIVALLWCDVEIIRLLLTYGANVNAVDRFGNTALLLKPSLQAARLLVQHGANVNVTNVYGDRAYMWYSDESSMEERFELQQFLLEQPHVNVNTTNNDGDTALSCAAINGDVQIVKLVLDKGATIDTFDNNGNTALILAAIQMQYDIMQYSKWIATMTLLLQRGANPDIVNKNGKNALDALVASYWTNPDPVYMRAAREGAELLLSYMVERLRKRIRVDAQLCAATDGDVMVQGRRAAQCALDQECLSVYEHDVLYGASGEGTIGPGGTMAPRGMMIPSGRMLALARLLKVPMAFELTVALGATRDVIWEAVQMAL